MTKAIPFVLAFFAALSAFAPVRAEPAKYVIDPEHFSIAMSVRHAGYFDLVGLFTEGGGSFVFDEAKPAVSDIKVTIKTASFFSGHKKRDDHVRSADFLNAKEFPEMVFVGKSSEKTGDRSVAITYDSSDFGMTYAVENGLVGDDVVLTLGFEARRQTP